MRALTLSCYCSLCITFSSKFFNSKIILRVLKPLNILGDVRRARPGPPPKTSQGRPVFSYSSADSTGLSSHHPLPPFFLVFLRSLEIGIAVPPPTEHVAVQAKSFRIPFLFSSTPSLSEGMLLCVGAPAMKTFWEGFVLFPACSPFIDRHNFVAMANRGVNLHRVTCHDLCPFPRMNFYHRLIVRRGLNIRTQI